MSTSVRYNGSQIATVSNETKILNTEGKWLTGDITITDNSQGGDPNENFLKWVKGELTTVDLTGVTSIIQGPFRYITTPQFTVNAPDLTLLPNNCFHQSMALIGVNMPKLKRGSNQAFYNTRFPTIVLPSLLDTNSGLFTANTALTGADFGLNPTIGLSCFMNCSSLETIVIRGSSVATLQNVNAFNGTKYANGGTGGVVYCRSDLIESYKTATNWSTLYDYGTVTFLPIEGSQYENYYVDGTAIS